MAKKQQNNAKTLLYKLNEKNRRAFLEAIKAEVRISNNSDVLDHVLNEFCKYRNINIAI